METPGDKTCSTEADEIITPDEYLKRQLDQEAEAVDALPGAFTECTFNLGPLNQPIYVCLTCKADASVKEKGPAGICYSCSISCHADHELLELFNKRDSICECGTKKFPTNAP
ncbi:hypothetical protein DSO57_1020568 [Entomophthora muscae]|uniref:Uncharacterized protein n=1 Tax=Entomophthora muscae TaxID=34485 RepID=A0ACC2U209_9FUNG|nr:hypothetical protein DSO57_1020568 [Entomophthora muscae]